ncbi:MAG: hypothetical protein EXR54_05070 [Dehalococcoidia bacterium]|nr:hypothetical protein [Dehalococcoidia bacterium]MSQ16924.1 hypothetical protein [Dehalococcoidia bacterium]
MLQLGWFATGRGPGSLGLLQFMQELIQRRELDASIQFVFCNREPGEAEGSDRFLQQVQSYGLPLVTFSSNQFRRTHKGGFARHREEFDAQVMARLKDFQPELCVLAGYMLIAGAALCRAYPLLNLHPALPDGPTGTWQEVIWKLIAQRAARTGAMTHLATEDVDRGPLISYCTAPIVGGPFDSAWQAVDGQDLEQLKSQTGEELPLFQLIRQAEYRREPYLLLETLRAIGDGRLVIRQGKVLDGAGRLLYSSLPHGLCLDPEIDRAMAADAAKT